MRILTGFLWMVWLQVAHHRHAHGAAPEFVSVIPAGGIAVWYSRTATDTCGTDGSKPTLNQRWVLPPVSEDELPSDDEASAQSRSDDLGTLAATLLPRKWAWNRGPAPLNENLVTAKQWKAYVQASALVTEASPSRTAPYTQETKSTSTSWTPISQQNLKKSGPSSNQSLSSTSRSAPSNVYVISDQFRITSSSDGDRATYMDTVDSAWRKAVGDKVDFLQIVLYRDIRLAKNLGTHEMSYVVIIVTANADLSLESFRAAFERIRPKAPLGDAAALPALVPATYSFLVIRDSIPYSYSSTDNRDDFMDRIQRLWLNALGKEVLTVAVAIYDDTLILKSARISEDQTETKQSSQEELHQLSYFVLVVSTKLLDHDDTKHKFLQHVTKMAVASLQSV